MLVGVGFGGLYGSGSGSGDASASDISDAIDGNDDYIHNFTVTVAANDSAAWHKNQADFVCDGTADDVQIQAAIDKVLSDCSKGGVVLLLPGTFYCSSEITLRTMVSLTGIPNSNIQNTVVQWVSGSNCDGLVYVADDSEGEALRPSVEKRGQFTVANLKLDSNNDGNYWVINITSDNAATDYIYDCMFERIYCEGGGDSADNSHGSMYIERCWSTRIVDCLWENSKGYGLYLGNANQPRIERCYSSHNLGDGYFLQGSSIQMMQSCGADCGDASTNSNGIVINGTQHAQLVNCLAIANYGSGYRINGSSYSSLTNCTAKTNAINATWSLAGFQCSGSNNIGLTFNNCIAYDNGGFGWFIATDYTRLLGCSLQDNTSGIRLQNTHTGTYLDCIMDNSGTEYSIESPGESPMFALHGFQETVSAASFNIEASYNGRVYIADCSSNNVNGNLPAAIVGLEYTFNVTDGTNDLILEPDGTDTIKLANGTKTDVAGDYITNGTANAADDGCRLKCVIAGVWEHYDSRGTWTEE